MLPPVTRIWPLAPNDGSVWVFGGCNALRRRSLDYVGLRDQVSVNVYAQIIHEF